jgi:hypothetical protein
MRSDSERALKLPRADFGRYEETGFPMLIFPLVTTSNNSDCQNLTSANFINIIVQLMLTIILNKLYVIVINLKRPSNDTLNMYR